MENSIRTDSINRTVSVVIKHALDLEHAVAVLVEEFGFDRTFAALAGITDDTNGHRAMWLAVAAQSDDDV